MFKFFKQNEGVFPFLTGTLPDERGMAAAYLRVFTSEDGQKVLQHLQQTACRGQNGMNASDAQLRYHAGQRGMVAFIERMILKARQG